MTRRRLDAPDPTSWPAFDDAVLPKELRQIFLARRHAIELYAQGALLREIEASTGVHRRQLYRLLDHCMASHDDGRPFGWRGIVRYARVADYCRVTRIQPSRDGTGRGAAGAFTMLLETHPVLARLRGLKHLHLDFLRLCREQGLDVGDYPFNTEERGIRSLSKAVRRECLRSFGRSALLAGASHIKGLSAKSSAAPAATRFLDVVEFDGHRLNVRLKVVVRDPLGFEQAFEIERIWLLVVLDVWSRAVLGWHVSLAREYSRHDVIRAIEAALEPHRPRTFTIPGVGYGALGGFPSQKLPELGYATWQWFKLDNARANLADDVRHALEEFIGCFVNAGPARTPDDRPYIERFFGSVATNLSSRLPGYTGSAKRIRLINKIKEACGRNGSGVVALFCDEAQRYDENEYEWLRDVHDHLDRLQIRLFTFLVGQQELLAVKTAFQRARKTQIVARLMVEELAFHGVRDAVETATCLAGYDQTSFPRGSDWSFTRFYVPQAVAEGYKLADDAAVLWDAFDQLHHKQGLPVDLEIPMESFTRVVEIVLKDCEVRDARGWRPPAALWNVAVRSCGYVQAR
jgi:transposase InsO family protein